MTRHGCDYRRLRRQLRCGQLLVRDSDIAVGYATIIAGVAVVLAILPGHLRHTIVQDSSTNLTNMRHHPVAVLAVSAFVVSSLVGLWALPVLVLAFAAAQRWVGRIATIFVAMLGHVSATLFVATLIASGITNGRLARSIAHASDVGYSYGLACIIGFVISRVPARWRRLYLLAATAFFAGPLLVNLSFTSVGHATSLALGLGLAFLASRISAAATSAVHREARPW